MQRSLTPLNYRTLRGLQISIVFAITVFIQQSLHYPRAGWTGFAVMMIYTGFDNGTILFRAYHRFWGAVLGLLSGYVLWFLGHVDYRILIIVIPITVFFAYFLSGKAYSVPTVFTVSTSLIGTGYFDPNEGFTVINFMVDYFMCTLIAFAVIITFEQFLFKRYHLMRRFIEDQQADALAHLSRLIHLLNQPHVSRCQWFKACTALTGSLSGLTNLLSNAHFVQRSEQAVGNEFNDFLRLSTQIYLQLKAVYIAQRLSLNDYATYRPQALQINMALDQLQHQMSMPSQCDRLTGAPHASSG